MKKIIGLLLLIFLGVGAAWAAGVRLNLKAIRFLGASGDAQVYRFHFRSGQVMLARLLEDRSEDVKVQVGDSTFDLAKSDLTEYHAATPQELASADYSEWAIYESDRKLVTYSKKKNLFLKLLHQAQEAKSGAGGAAQTFVDTAEKALQSGAQTKSGKTAMYEDIVRKNTQKKLHFN